MSPAQRSYRRSVKDVDREIVRKIADEAREEEANLVVWDKRDTFTVEPKAEVSVEDDYLKVSMEDGKATVYVEYDSIYKLVVEKERAGRAGTRAGFGATFS
jgi:sporulation-control protein spo0M